MTGPQWRSFIAAYLGWTLDAFDYFLLVLVVRHVAADFHTQISSVATALFLTLAMRPVGALVFGYVADNHGRRPALMASVLLYAGVELASAFAPTLGTFLVLRALFGIGMGGVWGVGASLAMESVPPASRGFLSGVLQQGYPVGYLLAALTYRLLFPLYGWRGMFIAGALPCLVVLFIWFGVKESPSWRVARDRRMREPGRQRSGLLLALRTRWPMFLFMVALMAAFNCFSHGTQDLYPSAFLEKQRGLPLESVTRIVMIYNVGAVTGGILIGSLSQRIGRRKAIAAGALLALPMIPLWLGPASVTALSVGAFLMQFAVQGAWGVVPAHLSELSPPEARGTFPGLAYQLGNLGASFVGPLQARIADARGGDYSLSLGWVVAIGAVALTVMALVGPEARNVALSEEPA